MIQGLKQLAKQIHENAKAKGFYDDAEKKYFNYHQTYDVECMSRF